MHGSGWDNLGDWSAPRATYAEAAEALARRLWSHAGVGAGARVLDVGCGAGAQIGVWRAGGAADVLGFEPDAARASAAAARWAQDAGVRVQQADAAAVGAESNGSRDVVVVLDALYHFADRARFIRDARRVLVDGGRLAFCTVVAPSGGRGLAVWRAIGRGFEMPDGVPGEGMLRDELAAGGFVDVRVDDASDAVLRGFATEGGRCIDAGAGWRRRMRVAVTRQGCRTALALGARYVVVSCRAG